MADGNRDYIGDGVYVSFDGWQLELTTSGISGENRIYLDPGVYRNLVEYVDELLRMQAQRASENEDV